MQSDKRSLSLTAALAASGLAVLISTPRPAPAWPPYLSEWQTIYPGSSTDDNVISGLGMGCAVCHSHANGGTGWNPYGWDIRKRILAGASTHDAIVASALWDSEANPKSWQNGLEIASDTQPGWTPGPNNIEYTDAMVTTGLMPLAIAGSLDPAASPMIPQCDAGVGGVVACPCGNPQDGLNRGCENSAVTTGAAMTAAGVASLASDTLTFTTGGERPTSFGILLQGNASIPAGAFYGQGVRCVGGNLKRLYNRAAVGGSISVPDLGMGDLSVSARSAQLGDTILSGQKRWYLRYYRDPMVLGGCPASLTFNSTGTGEVLWAP